MSRLIIVTGTKAKKSMTFGFIALFLWFIYLGLMFADSDDSRCAWVAKKNSTNIYTILYVTLCVISFGFWERNPKPLAALFCMLV